MDRRLTFDLLTLCWDDDRGKPHRRCTSTLPMSLGGALLLDAALADAVQVADGRVTPIGQHHPDPLVEEVVDQAARRRRPPKTKDTVRRLARVGRVKIVRDGMVGEGVLNPEAGRAFGVFPTTRYRHVHREQAADLRDRIRQLLLGRTDPDAADDHDVMLASLAGVRGGGLDVLVERRDRRSARERARRFGDGMGISDAVSAAVREAQSAAAAAAAAGGAAAAGAGN